MGEGGNKGKEGLEGTRGVRKEGVGGAKGKDEGRGAGRRKGGRWASP